MQGAKSASQFLQFELAVAPVSQITDKDTTKVIHIFSTQNLLKPKGHCKKELYLL